MMNWFSVPEHLLVLVGLLFLFLTIRGVDHLCQTVERFHQDFRKVHSLDQREENDVPN